MTTNLPGDHPHSHQGRQIIPVISSMRSLLPVPPPCHSTQPRKADAEEEEGPRLWNCCVIQRRDPKAVLELECCLGITVVYQVISEINELSKISGDKKLNSAARANRISDMEGNRTGA